MAELSHNIPGENGLPHREYIWPCDGGDAHYIRLARDPDPAWNYFWIEELIRPRGLRSKIRETWRLWRGELTWGEMVVDEQTAAEMTEALKPLEPLT